MDDQKASVAATGLPPQLGRLAPYIFPGERVIASLSSTSDGAALTDRRLLFCDVSWGKAPLYISVPLDKIIAVAVGRDGVFSKTIKVFVSGHVYDIITSGGGVGDFAKAVSEAICRPGSTSSL